MPVILILFSIRILTSFILFLVFHISPNIAGIAGVLLLDFSPPLGHAWTSTPVVIAEVPFSITSLRPITLTDGLR